MDNPRGESSRMSNDADDPSERYPFYESGTDTPSPLYDVVPFERTDAPTSVVSQACSEARMVLDHQISTLSDIDDKAARIFRVNILLVGLLLTTLSFVARRQPATGQFQPKLQHFINLYNEIGGIFLLGSIC